MMKQYPGLNTHMLVFLSDVYIVLQAQHIEVYATRGHPVW